MLEDGPLLAPSCTHLPPILKPEQLYHWFWRMEPHVITEICNLSGKSVLYEMALYHLQRPRHRRAAAAEGGALVALMKHFAEALRSFEHIALLHECRMLFINHITAGLGCIRFLPALERLLPTDASQYNGSDCLVQCASRCNSVLSSESGGGHCVAEEVDRERWVFRDTDEDVSRWQSHSGSGPGSGGCDGRGSGGRRLHLGADAKLAYTVTLFVWAVVRLLMRRLALLHEFPQDHPLFDAAHARQHPKVSALGDSYDTLFIQKREVLHAGKQFYRQGLWREAVDEFSRAATMPPDDEEGKFPLFLFRGGSHYHLGNYQEAVEDCTTALRYNPTAYAALYQRAEAYEALGRLELALQDLTQLVRLYPDSVPGREFHDRLVAALPVNSVPKSLSGNWAQPRPENVQALSSGSFPSPPAHRPSPNTSIDSKYNLDFPASPLSSDSSHLSFTSPELTFHLADLPEFPEPAGVDDPPYLAAFMESVAELEYTFCGRKELGHGAFGRVFKAVHPRGGWFLAVKVVEAHTVEGSDEFLRAMELLVAMKHTNIVRSLGMRRLPGFYHICLEYCSAGSLRSLADDLRGLPLPLLRKYAVEVLLGLRYIHSCGLLHRDVKASNVLLRDDGTAKVSDFGTCMRIPDADGDRSENVKGTVLWMAPEAFRGWYSTLSDMWSYGCMLIELATAKDPWHEQHFEEQLTAMVFIATRPDALPTAPPPLTDDLGRHFFDCCIARDPAQRVSADLLLRHPWLSSTNPIPAGAHALPAGVSLLDGPPQRSPHADHRSQFPWTICSSITASPFVQTDGSPLRHVEAGVDGVGATLQVDPLSPPSPSLP